MLKFILIAFILCIAVLLCFAYKNKHEADRIWRNAWNEAIKNSENKSKS